MSPKRKPPGNGRMRRYSVSFPRRAQQQLEEIARKKKVSVAWVVREAVEKYVADEKSLIGT